jgi:hypothetical protein
MERELIFASEQQTPSSEKGGRGVNHNAGFHPMPKWCGYASIPHSSFWHMLVTGEVVSRRLRISSNSYSHFSIAVLIEDLANDVESLHAIDQ